MVCWCVRRQYQNHNSKPGPVYAGGGYTPVSMAVGRFLSDQKGGGGGGGGGDSSALGRLLTAHPDLVNDVSTGGKTLPLPCVSAASVAKTVPLPCVFHCLRG